MRARRDINEQPPRATLVAAVVLRVCGARARVLCGKGRRRVGVGQLASEREADVRHPAGEYCRARPFGECFRVKGSISER